MKTHLLNSAMMPAEGTYTLCRLTKAEFATAVRAAHAASRLRSSVGYEQTASWIEQLCAVPVPLSRERTLIEDGDELLICRLAYRVAPGAKRQVQEREDWEYFRATYQAPALGRGEERGR